MDSWSSKALPECLVKHGVRRGNQIRTSEIHSKGRFPVVDQGQLLIAGFTDDEAKVVRHGLPYVIFGDHTRCFKYVDFPFVLGADGTKVLKPDPNLFESKFFYFTLLSLDIPSRGYNRHFQLLKEKSIRYPEKDEQRKISAVLSLVQRAIEQQEQLIALTIDLKKALMHKLFTEGTRGEPKKQTEIGPIPESWEVVELGSLVEKTEKVDMKTERRCEIQYIDVSSISRDFLRINSVTPYILRDAPGRARKKVREGDVIFATVRPTLMRIAHVNSEHENQVCSTAFCVLRGKSAHVDNTFIYYLVQTKTFIKRLRSIQSGASYPAVTDNQVKAQHVQVPSFDEQQDIAGTLCAVDKKIWNHEQKHISLAALFGTLLHQLMTAEIHVNDLDLAELDLEFDEVPQGESVS